MSAVKTPKPTKEVVVSSEDTILHALFKYEYHNSLPPPPSGPFYVDVNTLQHSFEEFGAFKLSSLEKSHVWQPHFDDRDLGLKVDLVDQEELTEIKPLDSDDLAYLHFNASTFGRSKHQSKAQTHDIAQSWFFRNTTYNENNLSIQTNKTKQDPTAATAAQVVSLKRKSIETSTPNLAADPKRIKLREAQNSFQACRNTIETLKQKNASKNVQLVESFDILPNTLLANHLISFVRYYEHPIPVNNPKRDALLGKSVITQVRPLHTSKLTKSSALECSVLIPKPVNDEELDLSDEEERVWLKDYVMDSMSQKYNESFMLTADKHASVAYFHPFYSRVELRKLTLDESKPIDATITRTK